MMIFLIMMMTCLEDIEIWWWLRSTTGPYGRSVLKVAYGEFLYFTPPRLYRENSLGRVVGVSACCITHARHTQVNTSMGSITLFFNFFDIKTYMYYAFKIYILYKRTLVVSDLVLTRWGSENVFDRSWVFKGNSKPQIVLWTFSINFVITVSFALFNL